MNPSGPKIISGVLQALDYTVVGAQAGNGSFFFERFLLMNAQLFEYAPLHIAAHIIKDLDAPPAPYAEIHCHATCDEIGLIVASRDELEYEIVLDGAEHRVKSPASVYIPSGTYHRARAVSGSGAYVCILLDPRGPVPDNVRIVG